MTATPAERTRTPLRCVPWCSCSATRCAFTGCPTGRSARPRPTTSTCSCSCTLQTAPWGQPVAAGVRPAPAAQHGGPRARPPSEMPAWSSAGPTRSTVAAPSCTSRRAVVRGSRTSSIPLGDFFRRGRAARQGGHAAAGARPRAHPPHDVARRRPRAGRGHERGRCRVRPRGAAHRAPGGGVRGRRPLRAHGARPGLGPALLAVRRAAAEPRGDQQPARAARGGRAWWCGRRACSTATGGRWSSTSPPRAQAHRTGSARGLPRHQDSLLDALEATIGFPGVSTGSASLAG